MPPFSELLKSTTNRLIAINVAIYFVLEMLFAGHSNGFELYYWQNPDFKIWQLFSYMFLHGSVQHLLFNMFGLWMFGRVLEQVWGHQRFLIFYLACGVGAAVVHLAVTHFQFQSLYNDLLSVGYSSGQIENVLQTGRYLSAGSDMISKAVLDEMVSKFYFSYHSPTVGASGAIYGILLAYAMMFPNAKLALIFLPVPIAAKYFVSIMLLIDLTGGLTGISIFGQNIAHFAHIGGAVVGFLLLQYWKRRN